LQHTPRPEELPVDEWKSIWARTKYLLKNGFVHGMKWEDSSVPNPEPEETEDE
jgi:hypothetical protein